jgi:hypothetical protein
MTHDTSPIQSTRTLAIIAGCINSNTKSHRPDSHCTTRPPYSQRTFQANTRHRLTTCWRPSTGQTRKDCGPRRCKRTPRRSWHRTCRCCTIHQRTCCRPWEPAEWRPCPGDSCRSTPMRPCCSSCHQLQSHNNCNPPNRTHRRTRSRHQLRLVHWATVRTALLARRCSSCSRRCTECSCRLTHRNGTQGL